jgi:hypothetical protein
LRIRVTRTPPGLAPQQIREAWVDLVLPVLERRTRWWVNVAQRPDRDTTWRLGDYVRWAFGFRLAAGFAVSTLDALTVLEASRPDAARWWWEHAPRAALFPQARLVFPRRCAEIVAP